MIIFPQVSLHAAGWIRVRVGMPRRFGDAAAIFIDASISTFLEITIARSGDMVGGANKYHTPACSQRLAVLSY